MKQGLARQTVGDLLRRTRQRFPNKLAIRCGGVDWTYAEFDDICDCLATGLDARGIEIGDRVAVISRNSHAFVALRFALARLGAVLVPINFMLSTDEANYILQHSGAKVLCVDSSLAKLGREASKGTDVRETVWLLGEDQTDPVPGLTTFQELLRQDVRARGRGLEPCADHIHEWYRIAPEGRHVDPRRADFGVRDVPG